MKDAIATILILAILAILVIFGFYGIHNYFTVDTPTVKDIKILIASGLCFIVVMYVFIDAADPKGWRHNKGGT